MTTDGVHEAVLDALQRGPVPTPPADTPTESIVVACWAGAVWGAALVVSPTGDPVGAPGELDSDTIICRRTSDGGWVFPDGWGGSGFPQWALRRPAATDPLWAGGPMHVGHQMAAFSSPGEASPVWVAAFDGLVAPGITTVTLTYGEVVEEVRVPLSGLFVVPAVIDRNVRTAAFTAIGGDGDVVYTDVMTVFDDFDEPMM